MKNTFMAARHTIALMLLVCIYTHADAQYDNLTNTVIDGGGKTFTTKVTGSNLQNVTFQNFVFTGNGGFEFISGTLKNVKVINNKANDIGRFISVGSSWGGNPAQSNNIEIACNEITNASGYVFYLHDTHNANVHHNKVVGTSQGGDGAHPGVYFINRSDGDFHHNWIENAYGNGFRVWGEGLLNLSKVNIYNCVVVGSAKYSAVEANGNYNLLPFNLSIDNCVFGNLAAADYISAGLTIYNLALNIATITNTKVFNTSAGLISNEGGLPSSTAGSSYFETMQSAGYSDVNSILLPDGTRWDDGGCGDNRPPGNDNPVAIAGEDKKISIQTTTLLLDGSKSYNPDGTELKFQWSQISGATDFSYDNANAAQVTLRGLKEGDYKFRLTVTNTAGKSAHDDIQVSVTPEGEVSSPVANAGEDQTISLPLALLTLNGSESTGHNGQPLQYSWSKISGPFALIATPWTETTSVVSLSEGLYQFRLTVTTPDGKTDDDTVAIQVKGIFDSVEEPSNHYSNISDKVIDGGGKTYTTKITGSNLKNVIFQNFVFTGDGGFEFTSGTFDNVKILNNKATNISRFIMIGGWLNAPVSTNFEIACNDIRGASGHVFYLANSHFLNVHHNSVINTSLGNDGPHPGVYLVDRSDGEFHHNWIENAYGNGYRIWGQGLNGRAAINIYNSVVVGSKKYSAVEANGYYNQTPFDLTIENCVFGNLNADDYISAGLVMYALGDNTASIIKSKVFNTSAGLFSNEGGVPASTEGSEYFSTVWEAGYTNINEIKLPDGSNWFDGGCDASTTPEEKKVVATSDKNELTHSIQDSVVIVNNQSSVAAANDAKVIGQRSFQLYPNPAINEVRISISDERMGRLILRLYDINGKIFDTRSFQKTASQFNTTVPLNKLAAGIYIVDITIDGASIMKKKLLKQ